MDILFELNLVQNTGLASCAVFEAVSAFCDAKEGASGLPCPLVFLVLPFVFHKRTVDNIKNRTGRGALFKAIKDDPELPLGLQKRMEALSRKTWEALSLAFSAKILAIDPDTAELFPLVRALPKAVQPSLPSVKDILKASKRLGKVFSEHSEDEIIKLLKVVF